MRPLGGTNVNCLSKGRELRAKKADKAAGRQGDRRKVFDGLIDHDDEGQDSAR